MNASFPTVMNMDLVDELVELAKKTSWDLPPGAELHTKRHDLEDGSFCVVIVNGKGELAVMMHPDEYLKFAPDVDLDSLERIEL